MSHLSALEGSGRYRLIVLNGAESGPRIQVFDCERGCQMFDWSGCVARHLLVSGELDGIDERRSGCYACDKYFVCHLALIAAASRAAINRLLPDVLMSH